MTQKAPKLTTVARAIVISPAATVATTAEATVATAAGSSAAAHALGLSLVDAEGTAVELVTVEVAARLLSIGRNHRNERKASHTASIPIGGEETVHNLSLILKELANGLLGGVEAQITDVQLDLGTAARVETSHTSGAEAALAIGGSFATGLGFVDADSASVELGLVHLGNGRLSGGAGAHTDEPKPTGSAGTTLAGEEDIGDGTEFAEDLAKAVLVGAYVAGIGVMSDK